MESWTVPLSPETSSDEERDRDESSGTGKRSYECTFCKRGFTNAQALGGHMNIHRKDRAKAKQLSNQYRSQQEDYISMSGSQFSAPIYTQPASGTGKRSYECTFCKRGFTNAQALGGHMNIHRKDRAKAKQLSNQYRSQQEDYISMSGSQFSAPIYTQPASGYYPVLGHHEHHVEMNYHHRKDRAKAVEMSAGDHANKEDNLPPGFRFHPTDEELITYYLMNKISDATFTGRAIADVDLNKCEPWELPAKAKMGEKEWYFFSLRDRKYPTGVRTNRATNTGYWKPTGKHKEIFNSATSELVGMKKTLVFYRGRASRGEKSNWVMHEYRIHSKSSFRPSKDEWVVCRVFQKSAGVKKYPPSNQSSSSSRIANPYNMELIGPSVNVVHSPIMQLGHDQHQFPSYSRSYMTNAEMAELSRVLRGGGIAPGSSSTSPMNLPLLQPQFNYPNIGGGGFTISGDLDNYWPPY